MHQCPNTTPAPWDWHEIAPDDPEWGACEIMAPSAEGDGQFVCTHVFSTANAKLIAAAPLMYEALANLENDDAERMPATAWKLVQDALAAARGETGN